MILQKNTKIALIILVVFLYLTISNTETFKNIFSKNPEIYILTRTSGRPKFFEMCKKSIESQTYKKHVHVTSCDDETTCKYVKRYEETTTLVPVSRIPKKGKRNCPYNMYNNNLIKRVPQGSWIIFLDDDGKFYDNEALERLSKAIKKSEKEGKDIIISLGDGNVNGRPNCWNMNRKEILKHIETDWHFAKIDTSHICIKNKPEMALWRYKCAGDAYFFHDNLNVGYEPYYNEEHIISGNYLSYGSGKREDIK